MVQLSNKLILLADFPHPGQISGKSGHMQFKLPAAKTGELQELCQTKQVTLFSVFIAGVYLVLRQYSRQDDINLATAKKNQTQQEKVDSSGFFIDTLAMRSDSEDEKEITGEELLKKVQTEMTKTQARQTAGQFEFIFSLGAETDGDIIIRLEYQKDIYKAETMQGMGRHLVTIMTGLAKAPGQIAGEIRLISAAEKQTLLREWNDTATRYPGDKCLHELFEAQARKTPDKTAVEFSGQILTYHELEARSTRLAIFLQTQGVQPDSLVGICVERSLDMIAGILGILKAGGAYVPMDPAYPVTRLIYMWEDSSANILLTQEDLLEKVRELPGDKDSNKDKRSEIILIDKHLETSTGQKGKLKREVRSNHLAYVIYTSGSTGQPKGVTVEHRQVLNTLYALQCRYPLEPRDKYLLKTNYVFDVSLTEIFGWFMGAGELVILGPGQEKDPLAILRVLSGRQITHINFVPSMFSGFVEMVSTAGPGAIKSLKYVLVAGEAFPRKLALESQKIFNREVKIENIYGPTEISIYGTWFSIWGIHENTPQVPIGRPLYNVRAYVLSNKGALLPPGIPGELYIGGAGVARGYLNQAVLTKKKFMDNPFNPGTRIYKTGDLARWLPEGNVEFLGRIDLQVKIRGFRIECGEIEAALTEHPGIREAVVIGKNVNNNTQLAAYYVTTDKARVIETNEARSFLEKKLPEYMIPATFVSLDAIPLNPSGKVDRKSLESLEIDRQSSREYTAPTTNEEMKFCNIWEQLLGIKPIGTRDNFFNLGGNSLLVGRLKIKVKESFGRVISFSDIYDNPTIKALAGKIYSLNREESEFPMIKKIPAKGNIPLSIQQEQVWFLCRLAPDNRAYNFQFTLRFKGKFIKSLLERCLTEIIHRHEIFRTTFPTVQGKPVQVIHEPWEAAIPIEDLRDIPGKQEREQQLEKLLEQKMNFTFDFTRLPLVRFQAIRLAEEEFLFLQIEHHFIHDGWSNAVFLQELKVLYEAYLKGEPSPLPPLPVQFSDFAIWQREWLDRNFSRGQLDYWLKKLAGFPGVLELAADKPRPKIQGFNGQLLRIYFPPELYRALRLFCRGKQTTLFVTLFSAFAVLLYFYTEQEDLLIGTGLVNRRLKETADLIGMIVNTIVLRVNLSGEQLFANFLQDVQEAVLEAHENQEMPVEKIVERLFKKRDPSRNPLFQVMFSFHDSPVPDMELPGLSGEYRIIHNRTAKIDINVICLPRAEQRLGMDKTAKEEKLELLWEYNTDIFKKATMERMINHYLKILKDILNKSNTRISHIEIIEEEERKKILEDFNDTRAEYPQDACVQQLFKAQVKKSPAKAALVFSGHTLTYGELDRRSTALALYLHQQGVYSDRPVGICMERSLELFIGIMGILKAGGGYVPIEPDYPPARCGTMLSDSNATILLVQGKTAGKMQGLLSTLSSQAVQVIAVDRQWDEIREQTKNRELFGNHQSRQLAYVIYTSGSTGQPKGVMVEHLSINRLVFNINYLHISGRDIFLQYAPTTFDAATLEIWAPLLKGARLSAAPAGKLSLRDLVDFVKKQQVTTAWLTAPLFKAMVEENIDFFKSLNTVLAGGDVLPANAVKKLARKYNTLQIINGYGPTENTTFTCCYRIDRNTLPDYQKIPIGIPISNTTCYILDGRLKPVPIGVPGELYTGGDGLARGYLNQPVLTSEKFINYKLQHTKYKQNTNPKLQITNKVSAGEKVPGTETSGVDIYLRLYRTGDLARWLPEVPEGNIEFLGRIDHQVKVRGFRIECGEIETALSQHPGIEEAVVIARNINNSTQLAAYYVSAEGDRAKAITAGAARKYLQETLPEYMIPGVFVPMEAIPLTPSGKVDRKALGDVEIEMAIGKEYIAPRTETEKQLVKIWEDVFGVEGVGICDNFFDLGGHSLLAARIISRINRELAVEVPLHSLFEAPCIEGLSGVIEELTPGQSISIGAIKRPDQLPLSYAQERLWYLVQLGYSQQYHVSNITKITGDLNPGALQKTFAFILCRHESLRTGFETIEHRAIQVIARDAVMGIEHSDLSGISQEEQKQESENILQEFVQRPFALESPPLMRVVLIKLEPAVHILGMCFHHIIFDGWSMGILTGEINRAYASYSEGKEPELAALTIHYADYAVWQREIMTPARLDSELNWWKQYLSGYEDLHLPTDFPRPGQLSGKGGYVISRPGNQQTQRLKTFCREKQVTLFTVFITGVYLMLSKYSRQEDICLGFPAANRDRQEIENLVGFFVNTLVVRIETGEGEQECLTGGRLLQRVQDNMVAAQDRQNVPFEKVVEILQPSRDLSRSPIFQVLVNYVNTPGEKLQLGECTLAGVDFDYRTSKFDLTVTFAEREDRDLEINLVYSRDLFAEITVKRMSEHLVKIITGLIDEPGKILDEIELLTEQEKQTLLMDWNDTTAPYPKDKCIHELFEEQVRKGPGKVACVLADSHLTYSELEARSTGLAIYLRGHGVRQDVCVGICLERSMEMIIGILGILKAGGAYVPIDAGYPTERILYMLEDSSARILVTSSFLERKVKEIKGKTGILFIDGFDFLEFSGSQLHLSPYLHPTDLAYVIYTSGSTGKPRGVMVQHDSAVNYLNVVKNRYGFDDIDDFDIGQLNFSFSGNFVFDAVTTSFLTPLIIGSTCVIYGEQEEQQEIILKAMNDPRVQVIKLTPAHIQLIQHCLPVQFNSKKIFIIGGESLKKSLVYQLIDKNTDNVYCINQYGPTECTIASTAHLFKRDISYGNEIYIGSAIANTQVYILSSSMILVPIGVPGELFIGGDGLARGYLNQPALTAEMFISEDSFGSIYRSGDLGRWLGDGNIEFLGRMDQQVKIRGFRIECGEIEAVLTGHPYIQDAVVLVRQINQEEQLAAYLVIDSENKKIETVEIRNYLQGKVPEYMIPVFFLTLEAIPLTPNGKIDRKALLKQEIEVVSSREYAGPQTGIEKQLVRIWETVLGVERVGILDNFFELGGHSLLATQIISRINHELKVEVPLRKLFETPHIAGLSAVIAGSGAYQTLPIGSIRRPGLVPLSYAQERLWFLSQLGYSEQYHVPEVLKISGNLDEEVLKKTMDSIVRRHEMLRTGFRTVEGTAIQVIEAEVDLEIEQIDLSGLSGEPQERKVGELVHDFVKIPFQLDKPPLMRVLLILLEPRLHILVICLHHIIFDGWSLGILTGEISRAYTAFSEKKEPGLTPLTIQYADYAVWQREVMTETVLDSQLRYWQEHLSGYEDLDLPTDYPRPGQVSGKGGHVRFWLERDEVRQLKARCQESRVTLFTAFMAGVYLLLRRYSRQEDICLGMPVANRNHQEIENLVGFFVNTLVIRINTGEQRDITKEQLLGLVQEEMVSGQDRQNVPFEKVVEVVHPTRDLSRTPIFQVLVNYVNTRREELRLGECQLEWMSFDYGISKFDLIFDLADREDGSLRVTIQYSRDLYREDTIRRMGGHLIKIINSLTEDPGQVVDKIELLTVEEKQGLLIEWNETAMDYPVDQCLHGLFMEQAEKTPLKAAVVFADQFLTFQELDVRSTRLAVVLKMHGINMDDLVGVFLERSLETIVCILGILKAGGAYMPVDVDYPDSRIRYMLEESKARVLLTGDKHLNKLISMNEGNEGQQVESLLQLITMEPDFCADGETSLPISALVTTSTSTSTVSLFTRVRPVDLAYIIYTSGSTGKPKGVMQTHRTIINLIAYQRGTGIFFPGDQVTGFYKHQNQGHVAQFAAHGFDVSIQEIFYAFLGGDVLFVIPGDIKQLPAEVLRFIRNRQINILYLPTAYLEFFLREVQPEVGQRVNSNLNSLERIIVAGEALKISSTIKEFFSTYSQIRLENQYGPSEAHVVTCFILPADTGAWTYAPPIGKPIANIRIFILNHINHPVPIGIPGELWLSGDGLARGYLNNPPLTSRKFRYRVLNKKFLRGSRGRLLQKEPPGRRRQYKTGDLARWLAEGNIEFLGRIDRQVKVRGFRVECGEIEAELMRHPGIREVVVLDRVINNTTQLIAYYVAKDRNREIEVNELRSYLQVRLPEYMVPGAFVPIDEIPLNANGKVDRKYLSRLEVELGGDREYVAPGTGLERRLVGIWEEVLGVGPVGIYDNFFQLGGHSLLALQIISRINNQLGVTVPLRSLFETPYIATLAGVISGSGPGRSVPMGSIQRPGRVPLSYAQERLWFLAQLGYSEQYHIPQVMKITGSLDEDVLQNAVDFILERHESLRTGFKAEAGKAFQVIEPVSEVGLDIEKIDLRELKLNPEKQDRKSQDIIREFIRKPFDLGQAPLMRAILIKPDDREHIFGMCQHHIIFDGWSVGILIREINQAYGAFLAGEEPGLGELTFQYADYAVWQREVMKEEHLDRELGYWQEHLAGYEDLDMPGDYPRPRQVSGKGGRVKFGLEIEESRQLKEFCRERQITLYTVLLTGVYLLLRRYSRQEDICLGMPAANRNLREIEELIGFFVNTLVIRIDTGGQSDMPVELLLGDVQAGIVAAQDRQDVPFARIVETLQPTRDLSRSPIFQVLVNYVNLENEQLSLGESQLERVDFDYNVSKFDLTFGFSERGDGRIGVIVEYSRDLFREESIVRLGGPLIKILNGMVEEPAKGLDEIELLSGAEKHTLLVEWNNTAVNYSHLKDKSLHELFLEQAGKTPDRTAVVFADKKLSYGELAARSAGVATMLKDRGIGPDNLVGIHIERSLEMIVGLLGILIVGGAYMPIDAGYPGDRIEYMIEDSRAKILVTSCSLEKKLKKIKKIPETIFIDSPRQLNFSSSQLLNFSTSHSKNLAYVIYTSGSTGKPKGVMVDHRAICNRIVWMQEEYPLTRGDGVLQKTPFSFDVSVWEFFWPVMAGARLIFALPGKHREPDYLADLIEKEHITTLHFVPSMLRAFLEVKNLGEKVSCIKRLISSGEALSKDLQDNCLSLLDCELLNLYGPTEAAVEVSWWRCHQDYAGGVPIGRPIANIRLYILDNNLRPVPIGIPGELHIGGIGLGRGYLNQPGLTMEKFINYKLQNTKYKQNTKPKLQRIYRTGDLTRWLVDGNIEYLGRIDFQVKIRGFRIESGEIETGLTGHPGIREAVVIARNLNNTTQLAAFFVAQNKNNIPGTADIRRFLQDKLPEYMIPAVFVSLEEIPLTPNGKVDRKTLTKLEIELESRNEYVAPRTKIEMQLARIWAEVLGIEKAGIEDNFFELGGHSLLATRIISRIQKELEVDISLNRLFEAPTIKGLSELVAESNPFQETVVSLCPGRRPEQLPLSYAQERLWFLAQMDDSRQNHMHRVVQVNGHLDIEALQKTFHFIAARHENLRTSVHTLDGRAVQVIEETTTINIEQEDLRNLKEEEREKAIRAILREVRQQPFDLKKAPLMRVVLIKTTENSQILGICQHHIISDGWSIGILIKEIRHAYAAFLAGKEQFLENLEVQYADYAVWQREWFQGDVLEKQVSYWKQQLHKAPALLKLPTDKPRPLTQTFSGDSENMLIPKALSDALKNLGQNMGTTLFMTLLAAFKVLLHRFTGEEDIVVGSPIAGRNRAEIEKVIGFFLNSLVLRTDLSGNPGFNELLLRVRQVTLGAYAHQDLPFEKLLEELQPERSLSHTPLFQVFFNMLNLENPGVEFPHLEVEPMIPPEVESPFDLTLYLREDTDGIHLRLVYNIDLFEKNRMKEMLEQYWFLLGQIAANPQEKINGFSLVTDWARAVLPDPLQNLDSTWEGAVHTQFSQQAQCQPQHPAVRDNQVVLTYSHLDTLSNKLARHLVNSDVRPQDTVAIYGHRSAFLVVAVLGILKAGAAFLILDPMYPDARLIDYLDQARPRAFIQLESAGDLPGTIKDFLSGLENCPGIELPQRLDDMFPLLDHCSGDDPQVPVGPDDLAYIAFTSGSTGKPKGILGRHGPLSHFLPWMQETFDFQKTDRFSMLSGLSHDPLHRDIFTPLWLGASICIPDADDINSGRLAQWMKKTEINITHLTPAMGQVLTQNAPDIEDSKDDTTSGLPGLTINSLRYAFFVGDVLTRDDVLRLKKTAPGVTCVNLYGSTETQRAVGHYMVSGDESNEVLPLGRGMKDVQLLVMNSHQQLAGIGEIGEILVRSPHLARGYLEDEAMTGKCFIRNPFPNLENNDNDRVYCTGDLGRYRANGDAEFAGRQDNQVKIRGFRIELGEIESALSRHPQIQEVVVIARAINNNMNNNTQLIAFYVPGSKDKKATPDANQIRNFLKDRLPDYMVPAGFVPLESIPLTPNRKVDREALSKLEIDLHSSQEYVPPGTEIEKQLAMIWEQVLGKEKIGSHDDFFELGGHSLLAIQMFTKVREQMGVECPLKHIFDHSTIHRLAPLLQALTDPLTQPFTGPGSPDYVSIPGRNIKPGTSIPLGNGQLMPWLVWLSTGSTWNLYRIYDVNGPIDVPGLEQSFNTLVQRHSSLWATISPRRPAQKITLPRQVPLSVIDLRDQYSPSGQESLEEAIKKTIYTRFALTSPPLIRLRLIQIEDHQYKLVLAAPHIAMDNTSFLILFDELMSLYQAFTSGLPLPPKRTEVSFSDFLFWEHETAKHALSREVDYWQHKLESVSLLQVPDSYILPPDQPARPQSSKINPTLLDSLIKISRQQQVSLPMSLSAVIAITLHRLTSQKDMCLSLVFDKRLHQNIKDLVSSMVDVVPIRIQIPGDTSFLNLIARIKQTTLEAYDHVRGSSAIPNSFLYRPHQHSRKRLASQIQEHTLRFLTWLLSRLWFPSQTYPTLFYAIMAGKASNMPLKKKPAGKKHNNPTDTPSPPAQDGMNLFLNIFPDFYRNSSRSTYSFDNVTFTPAKSLKKSTAPKANVLYFTFANDHDGNPVFMVNGMRLTPFAHQRIIESFNDVLETVVKNPHLSLIPRPG